MANSTQLPADLLDPLLDSMLNALETAAHALDRLSHGADFDRVVEETDVTNLVLTAVREAKTLPRAHAASSERPRPMTSAGHPVDLAEVAEWVGLHYRVNFDAAGERQQEWIDRFAAAHRDDARFASYLVAEHWGHIFIGKSESTTRWVFRLGGGDEGVIHAQILGPLGRWTDLDAVAMKDIEESIYDNDIPDTYRKAWASEVRETLQLPTWAPASPRHPEHADAAAPAERPRG